MVVKKEKNTKNRSHCFKRLEINLSLTDSHKTSRNFSQKHFQKFDSKTQKTIGKHRELKLKNIKHKNRKVIFRYSYKFLNCKKLTNIKIT